MNVHLSIIETQGLLEESHVTALRHQSIHSLGIIETLEESHVTALRHQSIHSLCIIQTLEESHVTALRYQSIHSLGCTAIHMNNVETCGLQVDNAVPVGAFIKQLSQHKQRVP